jgi:hypothetical protein
VATTNAYRLLDAHPNLTVVPSVLPIGDSITFGVGGTTAGFRGPLYALGQAGGTGKKFTFIGSQVDADGPLVGIDPNHEGHPLYVVKAGASQSPPFTWGSIIDVTTGMVPPSFAPQIVIAFGGTNDLAANVLNDTTANAIQSISDWWDLIWAQRNRANLQIVVCTILKRLDGDDSKVQTVNAAIRTMATTKPYAANIVLCDWYNCIQDQRVGFGYHDVVHPADPGYSDMANFAWTPLQVAIARVQA